MKNFIKISIRKYPVGVQDCFRCDRWVLYLGNKIWKVCLLLMLSSAIYASALAQANIRFKSQFFTRSEIETDLLVDGASYYLLQNFVKQHNSDREVYHLEAYIYNQQGANILERLPLSPVSGEKYKTDKDFKMAIYRLERSDLEKFLTKHITIDTFYFIPDLACVTINGISKISDEYIGYAITTKLDNWPRVQGCTTGEATNAQFRRQTHCENYLYLRPYPPNNMSANNQCP